MEPIEDTYKRPEQWPLGLSVFVVPEFIVHVGDSLHKARRLGGPFYWGTGLEGWPT
jgi:hypothetical protein